MSNHHLRNKELTLKAKGLLSQMLSLPEDWDYTPPGLDNPILENPTQLNKDIKKTDLPKKEKIITDEQSTHSIPILSPNPSPYGGEAAQPPERKRKEADAQTAFEIYREIIKDNISYDILMQDMKFDGDRLDEIVDLMLETVLMLVYKCGHEKSNNL